MIYNRLLDIFDEILGSNKGNCSELGQVQYNCPECSLDSNMLHGDGKYNLELNFSKGVFKCWKCDDYNDMHGKLSRLIRNYGNNDLLVKYKEEVKMLHDHNLLTMFKDEESKNVDVSLTLPKGCKSPLKNYPSAHIALNYLRKRGIDEYIIKKFNILYTDFDVEDKKMINRIIIPSFDKFGNLNYWVGRKYDEFPGSFKYWNPNTEHVKKTDIVFNGGMVNWDGDVRLVEGPFDHIVVPNSIPLLGKDLNNKYLLFKTLFEKVNGTITIFLDSGAIDDVKKIYSRINTNRLKGKIRYVTYNHFREISSLNMEFNELDPSIIHEKYGKKGIIKALKDTATFSDLELIF